jgi:hypothetical protein
VGLSDDANKLIKVARELYNTVTGENLTEKEATQKFLDLKIVEPLDVKSTGYLDELRHGQYFMNELFNIDVNAYKYLCEQSDCFYDDSKLGDSIKQLKEYWQKNKEEEKT